MVRQNSFLHPLDEVRFGSYKPADVAAALDVTEKIAKKRLRFIAKIPANKRTFENTVLGIVRADEEFSLVCNLVAHFQSVLGEPWREADLLMNRRASALSAKIFMNATLYKAIKDVPVPSKPHFKRFYDDIVRAYEHSGVNLPAEQQKLFKRWRQQLSDATTRFGQNDTKTRDETFLVVKREADLEGIAGEFIARYRKVAQERNLEGWVVEHDPTNAMQIMARCSVARTRERYYKLVCKRGKKRNGGLVKKILLLRQQMAHSLSYTHYGDYAADGRMAKKAANAMSLLTKLKASYAAKAKAEFTELQAFAREYEKNPKLELHMWDVDTGLGFFYADKLREKQVAISEEGLKAYFPLDKVLEGMFKTLGMLYGLRFKKASLPVWHKDVEVYELRDETGAHIATVWCDWYARKGKRNGAWMSEIHTADRADGRKDKPHLGYVCANLDPPTESKPSLLTFQDVETVWHEFGHFIHFALSNTELREQAMDCPPDFIEAPSQIMENWVWQPEVLSTFARHYKTGQILPAETLEKLQSARTFRVASAAMFQLQHATVDLLLHTEFNAASDANPLQRALEIKQQFYVPKVLPTDGTVTTFTHIFDGGYAAGYYSYKWSEVIEADLFSRFEKEGILNPQTGRAYAREILSRGGEADPNELVKNFLGRPATPDALLRRDGVK